MLEAAIIIYSIGCFLWSFIGIAWLFELDNRDPQRRTIARALLGLPIWPITAVIILYNIAFPKNKGE